MLAVRHMCPSRDFAKTKSSLYLQSCPLSRTVASSTVFYTLSVGRGMRFQRVVRFSCFYKGAIIEFCSQVFCLS